MSFDIFLQRFDDGPAGDEAEAVRGVIQPFVSQQHDMFIRLTTDDGGADLYGDIDRPKHFMINHAAGTLIWDIVFRLAVAGRFAIMPVGCPTFVTDPALAGSLPAEIAADVRIIGTGEELLQGITSA